MPMKQRGSLTSFGCVDRVYRASLLSVHRLHIRHTSFYYTMWRTVQEQFCCLLVESTRWRRVSMWREEPSRAKWSGKERKRRERESS